VSEQGNDLSALLRRIQRLEDIEAIRKYLKISRWVIFGSSWGAALALLYAEAHPDTILRLLVCGTTLCRESELNWLYQPGGASRVFPEEWLNFITHVPEKERQDLLGVYHQRLDGNDELARLSAAKAWSQWHAICSTLQPNPNLVATFIQPHLATNIARMQTHYFKQHIFLKPNQILKESDRLTNVPGIIIHGRYDMICPVDNAYDLHCAWLGSELQIVRDAGHSNSEPGIVNAIITATNQIAHDINRDLPGVN